VSENRSMERVRARRATNGSVRIHASRSTPARPVTVAWRVGVSTDASAAGSTHRTSEAEQIAQVVQRLRERRPTRYERFVKPVVDRLVGALLLLVAVPALLVIALAVWVTLGSPVFIRQERVGRGGRSFHMLKFRTMRPDRRESPDPSYSGPERRVTHKSPQDPRHTPLGRKLRQNSLDELPQLINIVRGDMSLVGPRPELRSVTAGYEDWQHLRHIVRPGLTGLWQITERANGTVMHEHTELDLHYVQRLSASTDLGILLRTPRALLKKEQVH
jgi:lipopolysaccharide/colanic/teichoic acid biosynthesis glycosyltransferase